MSRSILQTTREMCYLCHAFGATEEHHVFNNNPNRKLSDKYGLTVYLCPQCHRNVHSEYGLREHLKQTAQREAMKKYGWSVDDFRRIFGKNYL